MRTIKRYSNRKLYDTQEKRYITLEQISELVNQGEDIKVIDNQTGEDLTTVTLSQVLLGQEKKKTRSLPKSAFLEMIQKSSNSVMDTFKKTVFTWFENAFVSEEAIEKNVDALAKGGEISKDEAHKLKNEFKSRALAFKKRIDDAVERRVDEVLGALHIPSKSEFTKLQERIEALTRQVEDLTKKAKDKGEEPEKKAG